MLYPWHMILNHKAFFFRWNIYVRSLYTSSCFVPGTEVTYRAPVSSCPECWVHEGVSRILSAWPGWQGWWCEEWSICTGGPELYRRSHGTGLCSWGGESKSCFQHLFIYNFRLSVLKKLDHRYCCCCALKVSTPDVEYLLIMTRCSCKTRCITLKAIVLEICSFVTKGFQ